MAEPGRADLLCKSPLIISGPNTLHLKFKKKTEVAPKDMMSLQNLWCETRRETWKRGDTAVCGGLAGAEAEESLASPEGVDDSCDVAGETVGERIKMRRFRGNYR